MPRTTQPPIDGHKTRMTIDCILRLSCGPGFEVKLTSEVLTVGMNLLVKDFCYLRTVNVPAAVRSLSGWNIGTKVALDE